MAMLVGGFGGIGGGFGTAGGGVTAEASPARPRFHEHDAVARASPGAIGAKVNPIETGIVDPVTCVAVVAGSILGN